MATRITSYSAFWPYYLGEHSKPGCRALHYVGTTLALVNLLAFLVTLTPWFLLGALISGYAFAWIGHFFVEQNLAGGHRTSRKEIAADSRESSSIGTDENKRSSLVANRGLPGEHPPDSRRTLSQGLGANSPSARSKSSTRNELEFSSE